MDKLVNSYIMSTVEEFDLNCIAARVLLNAMPGLESAAVFQDMASLGEVVHWITSPILLVLNALLLLHTQKIYLINQAQWSWQQQQQQTLFPHSVHIRIARISACGLDSTHQAQHQGLYNRDQNLIFSLYGPKQINFGKKRFITRLKTLRKVPPAIYCKNYLTFVPDHLLTHSSSNDRSFVLHHMYVVRKKKLIG